MLGILLLLIALVCYFRKDMRWLSYILYIGFLSKGYIVLTDSVMGVKNQDLAVVYTFIVGAYLLVNNRLKCASQTFGCTRQNKQAFLPSFARMLPRLAVFRWLRVFMLFLVGCVLFSLFYYHFTVYQVFQGGRAWLLIFSIPILIRMSPQDFERVVKIVGYITLLTAAVYILQIVVGRALLPYAGEAKIDRTTGLIRLYNFPPFLTFYLILSFVSSSLFQRIWVWRVTFVVALICTQGRTMIFADILAVLIAVWMQRGAGNLIKIAVVLLLLLIPFSEVITNRYEGGKTGIDLSSITHGAYEDYNVGSEQTMTFRLALLYERANYLAHRPIGEQFFGMGLISDSQPIVQKMYRFYIGLADEESGDVSQLHSPDIAWVNTICGLGFGGTAIYLVFLISLTIFFFRHRGLNYFFAAVAAMLLCSFITSFAGSGFSECRTLAIYFVVMSLAFNKQRKVQ